MNSVTHTYMLSGSQVIGERWGTNVLLYLYDENGSPMGLAYRNDTYAIGSYTYYYFDKNLQGDIVGGNTYQPKRMLTNSEGGIKKCMLLLE